MKIDLSDGLKDELNTPVKLRWLLRAVLVTFALTLLCAAAWTGRGVHEELSERQEIEALLKSETGYNLRRRFRSTPIGDTPGTYWNHCGVTITAGHVHVAMDRTPIEDALGPTIYKEAIIDAAFYGHGWLCEPPRQILEGERVWIAGYPAGSDNLALRSGEVYLRRAVSGSHGFEKSTYIVVFDPLSVAGFLGEPVAVGMSGGIVVDADLKPVGILVTRNFKFSVDIDGEGLQGSDIVSLYDAHSVLIRDGE